MVIMVTGMEKATRLSLVDPRGIEPLISSLQMRRSTTELRAQNPGRDDATSTRTHSSRNASNRVVARSRAGRLAKTPPTHYPRQSPTPEEYHVK